MPGGQCSLRFPEDIQPILYREVVVKCGEHIALIYVPLMLKISKKSPPMVTKNLPKHEIIYTNLIRYIKRLSLKVKK
jgi:hypothetical protein